jgi:hypothetical protein
MRKSVLKSPHVVWATIVVVVLSGWFASWRHIASEIENQKNVARSAQIDAQTARSQLAGTKFIARSQTVCRVTDIPESMKEWIEARFKETLDDDEVIEIGILSPTQAATVRESAGMP